MLETVRTILEDKQAEDIVVIDLRTSFTDHMVIATGHSARQIAAITSHLLTAFKAFKAIPAGVEGLPLAEWVLLDAGEVIVHLFRPEARMRYNLEKMWLNV